jgi:uncharacterized protein
MCYDAIISSDLRFLKGKNTVNSSVMAALQAAGGGILIGLASWLLLAALGRIAGVSGIAAAVLVPAPADNKDGRMWRVLFLLGLVIGGAAATALMPAPVQPLRPIWLLVAAGLLVGFGTVLGSGCTSGHGVCGLGRRSLRSLAATLVFMAVGFATTFAVFSILGRSLI